MLGNQIGGFIVITIGLALLPSVANQVVAAQNSGNLSSTSNTIVGLVTVFYAMGVMTAGVGLTVNGLRQAGLVA